MSSAGAWSASAGAPPAELLAGFWHRAVGFVVDLVIIVLIVQVAYAALFPRELDLIGTEQGILQVGTVNLGVRFAYNWFFNARGWSPGKRVVGLRIVTAAGQPPGAGPGLARALGAILSEAALWLGYAWASLDGRRQTWHDKIGGTYVIRVSAPRKQTPD